MPRLPAQLLRRAAQQDARLVPLLRQCRDWTSAQNEFRWLKEHVSSTYSDASSPSQIYKTKDIRKTDPDVNARLARLCRLRGRAYPLQYLLGTEYFGDLELQVKPGVLIPRQETATAIEYLVHRFLSPPSPSSSPSSISIPRLHGKKSVLDLCTGTGCIAHLIRHLLRHDAKSNALDILGVDISSTAVELARKNGAALEPDSTSPVFAQGDVLGTGNDTSASTVDSQEHAIPTLTELLEKQDKSAWDIVVANPPYISPLGFMRETERSVRRYEPTLALVPPEWSPQMQNTEKYPREDLFYPRILDIARQVGARLVWVEVGDLRQAERVASYISMSKTWTNIEIWREQPGQPASPQSTVSTMDTEVVPIRGEGNGRSVVCWQSD